MSEIIAYPVLVAERLVPGAGLDSNGQLELYSPKRARRNVRVPPRSERWEMLSVK